MRLVEHPNGACSFQGALFRHMRDSPEWREAAENEDVLYSDSSKKGKVKKYLDGLGVFDSKVLTFKIIADLDFVPPTFCISKTGKISPPLPLPAAPGLWFLKPATTCRGHGIQIRTDPKEFRVVEGEEYVIQKEVKTECILDGRKSDWRVFCCIVYRGSELKAFVYKRGLHRPCLTKYTPDSLDPLVHLSNRSVQAQNESWDLEEYTRAALAVRFFKPKQLEEIVRIWRLCVERVAPLCRSYGQSGMVYFGVDVIIDPSGKVWLLEVNQNPGLSFYGEQVFQSIHKPMITELIDLAIIPLVDNSKPIPDKTESWIKAWDGTINAEGQNAGWERPRPKETPTEPVERSVDDLLNLSPDNSVPAPPVAPPSWADKAKKAQAGAAPRHEPGAEIVDPAFAPKSPPPPPPQPAPAPKPKPEPKPKPAPKAPAAKAQGPAPKAAPKAAATPKGADAQKKDKEAAKDKKKTDGDANGWVTVDTKPPKKGKEAPAPKPKGKADKKKK
eukprot:NODE_738_length_1816_cov_46.219015_g600_i0.p1 GENE.NODE_738_length_1816_cov_46.219015_g600_i0~~NODE_738_length_1816_cov_46.219015_g600_i0.p1  ORF type:complete len:570 (+),score=176.06 NODE_738_length_1816_cov_46.219015_g600_i0:211-1710(+)